MLQTCLATRDSYWPIHDHILIIITSVLFLEEAVINIEYIYKSMIEEAKLYCTYEVPMLASDTHRQHVLWFIFFFYDVSIAIYSVITSKARKFHNCFPRRELAYQL